MIAVPTAIENADRTPAHIKPMALAKNSTPIAPVQGLIPMVKANPSARRSDQLSAIWAGPGMCVWPHAEQLSPWS